MFRPVLALVLAVSALAAATAEESAKTAPPAPLNSARILLSKTSLSHYAIENMEYVLEYFLVNVGDRPALKVSLDDRKSFPTQDYEHIKGLLQVQWERIGAGENVSHSVVVKPRRYGIFNHTSALVTYYPSEEAKEARVGHSTTPGEATIYSQKSYERRFGQRWSAWLVFLVLAAPTTLIPFYLWTGLRNRYPETNEKPKNEWDTKKKAK